MTMASDNRPIIKQLTRLLKENGTSILCEGAPLCLTARFLQFLNSGFTTFTEDDFGASFEALPGSSTQVPLYQEIQFLYDFIQKTPKLKLLSDTIHDTGEVSVVAFRSLRELELKRVPVATVTGMNKLRGRLQTLVCTRCLSRIQDIVECCAEDSGSTLLWNQLTTLCLSYNFLIELDNSLRLLPVLRFLDLSHNNIEDPECYLEHLTELEEADLSYNLLRTIPSFSLSCRNKLTRLHLRHNHLEHVEGIQELCSIQDLDLAYNCLSSHYLLQPLKVLHRLTTLTLEGNPLCHHAKHRYLTVEHLHPLVAKLVLLDRKPISEQESMFVSHRFLSEVSRPLPRRPIQTPGEPSSVSGTDFLGSLEESLTHGNSLPSLQRNGMTFAEQGKTPRKKKSRSHKKARRVEISDMDDVTTGADSPEAVTPFEPSSYSSNKYVPSVTDEQLTLKKEIETIRNQLGPDWLQTLTATRESANRISVGFESTNKNSEPQIKTPDSSKIEIKIVNTDSNSRNNPSNDIRTITPILKESVNDTSLASVKSLDKDCEGADYDTDSPLVLTLDSSQNNVTTSESGPAPPSGHEGNSESVFTWSRSDTADIDYGSESEPFIVQRPGPNGNHSDHFLITIAERYLLEKDIEGVVIETLDQRCLQRVGIVTQSDSTDLAQALSDGETVVRLYFDYYKKDKTERFYIMEDLQTAQSLVELLEPSLELREMAVALKDRLQCLKCNEEFSHSEVTRKKKKPGDITKCPKCKSDLIIELDVGQISRSVGQPEVMTNDQKTFKPESMLHEPTAQSTPVKGRTANRLVYGSGSQNTKHSPGRTSSNHSLTSLDNTNGPRRSLLLDTDSTGQAGVDIKGRTNRQASESSDIEVLDSRPSITSLSGEINILSVNSEATLSAPALSPIYDSPISQMLESSQNTTSDVSQGHSTELTPCGSLSNNAIHSMVSSIYENSIAGNADSREFYSIAAANDSSRYSNHSNKSFQSINDLDGKSFRSISDTVTSTESSHPDTSISMGAMDDVDSDFIRFSHTDYSFIDHRLKLYLTLEVIGDDEVSYILQCGIVELDVTEYTGAMMVTNNNLYIFSMEQPLSASKISSSMKLLHTVKISDVQYIDIGLEGQCFRLRTSKLRLAFLIRDKIRCKSFLKPFTALVQKTVLESDGQLEGIKTDHVTPQNLISQVLGVNGVDSDTDTDTDICLFVMCHLQVASMEAGSNALAPVSVVVTPSHVAMATENYQYMLQSHDQTSHDQKSHEDQQFELKDRQKVTDLTTLELKQINQLAIIITFTEEGSTEDYTWRLVMATTQSRDTFVSMVTKLWEQQFGVEFNVTYS